MPAKFTPIEDDAVLTRVEEVDEDVAAALLSLNALVHRLLADRNHYDQLLPTLLRQVQDLEPRLFWRLFEPVWSCCKDTWTHRKWVLKVLRRQLALGHFEHFMGTAAVAFYRRLPEKVTIYRSSGLARRHGLSWTTDLAAAAYFAQQRHAPRSTSPTVWRAQIDCSSILAVVITQGESEVLVDPACLSNVDQVDPIRLLGLTDHPSASWSQRPRTAFVVTLPGDEAGD